MKFLVYCVDDPSTPNAREENYPQHRSHLGAAQVKILVAGPYTEKESDRKIGSMLLIEAATYAEVSGFVHRDPFYVAKVWSEVRIHPYIVNINKFNE